MPWSAKLGTQRFSVEREVLISIEWAGLKFAERLRADLIVERNGVVELKSVKRVDPAHKQQFLTDRRLTVMKLGYLPSFGEALMKDGITRIVRSE